MVTWDRVTQADVLRALQEYEFATGERLAPADFEGGKTGAVAILSKLGFTVQPKTKII